MPHITAALLSQAELAALAGALLLGTLFLLYTFLHWPTRILINDRKPFEFGYSKARKRYMNSAGELIRRGFMKVSDFWPVRQQQRGDV